MYQIGETVKAVMAGNVSEVYDENRCLVSFHAVEVPMLASQLREAQEIEDMLIDALCTDGAQHKQYYLYKIAALFGLEVGSITHDKGIAP